MIEAPHYSATGSKQAAVPLPAALFDGTVNEPVLHRAVVTYLANQRQGTHETKTQRWTVLRSPHIDKKSREQFELKTHKRLIDILDSRPQTVDALTKLDLPAGVDVEIKVE